MGAGFSGEPKRVVVDPIGEVDINTGLSALPESCLAIVLMGLEADEVCKLAGVNREFREASSADMVWESKLPENYKILVNKLFDHQNLSKKDIYFRLCLPNRFDGDTKVN
ncbi:F-box protein PP2-A13 [Impatiens glandulifera]|uniref:F-box protein PP2-A13 n=1 Tax=Impatiens glandulifera TaxID=253017 RepID=UPI001FB08B69|nr:F-box protein PP2-A13 [Impatiens glandulifera]